MWSTIFGTAMHLTWTKDAQCGWGVRAGWMRTTIKTITWWMCGRRLETRRWGFAIWMKQQVPTSENCVTVGLFWMKPRSPPPPPPLPWAIFSSHSPWAALHSPLGAVETRTVWCFTDGTVEMLLFFLWLWLQLMDHLTGDLMVIGISVPYSSSSGLQW